MLQSSFRAAEAHFNARADQSPAARDDDAFSARQRDPTSPSESIEALMMHEVATETSRAQTTHQAERTMLRRERSTTAGVTPQMLLDLARDVEVLDQKLRALTERKERGRIYAPASGIVRDLRLEALGMIVPVGRHLVRIAPAETDLQVRVEIPPAEAAALAPGMRAVLRLSTSGFSEALRLEGSLERVSVSAAPDRSHDGHGHLHGYIRLDQASSASYREFAIQEGMAVDVEVITGRQTTLSAVAGPIRRIQH